MLLGIGRGRYDAESTRDTVHNYYEQMVIDQLLRSYDRANNDAEFLADAACVALNHLPPKYVRHDVDMTFFLTQDELESMVNRVVHAVNNAVSYVESREVESREIESREEESINQESNKLDAENTEGDLDDTPD